jgi:phospholipid-binding lipoprotein MlaA
MITRPPHDHRQNTYWFGLSLCVFLAFFLLPCLSLHGAEGPEGDKVEEISPPSQENSLNKTADEYGDVTEEQTLSAEGPGIADPIEPWNRAMYLFNDAFYFWLLKPAAEGYRYVLPEEVRVMVSNFYQNIKAPIRIVNNLLQGDPEQAMIELGRFVINTTAGLVGLRDCARDCFGITGREADFGQTLGKYGLDFGFYIVWPFLGPSSPRDTVGWVADLALTPTSYISSDFMSPWSVGLYAHNSLNRTSFQIGDYETIKKAAIDPYVAIRDAYVQSRKKAIEKKSPPKKP